MKRILLAPERTRAALATGVLLAAGFGVFSSSAEEGGLPAGTAGAAAEAPSSPSKKIFSSAVADKTSVSIGDRVVVTYSAKLPAGATLSLDSLVTPAPEEGARPPGGAVLEFELPSEPTLKKSGDFFEWSQSVALFPFVAGTVQVPGPHYTFEESSSGRRLDVRPPSVELTVASRLPKDQKPEQIAPKADKGIRIPPIPAKFWAALGAVVALAAGLVWWGILRRRRQGDLGVPASPPVPPGEELRLELDRLAPAVDTLGDDARGFYSELTHAVKRYLERTTGDPVLEWTTFETVRRFREKGFDLPADVALPELLASADRVKFGKGAATRDDAREGLARARRLHDHVEAREAARRAAEAAAAASAKRKAS
ncbi:MAG TPA: hypothetical protein PLB01_10505 [Thermoanaerobaculia bacterium]|nr:hypothetical protein [Thermoanaerobaculia bacterium]